MARVVDSGQWAVLDTVDMLLLLHALNNSNVHEQAPMRARVGGVWISGIVYW